MTGTGFRPFFSFRCHSENKTVLEKGLGPTRLLIEDSSLPLRVRGWAAYCLGAICAAGLDSGTNTVTQGKGKVEEHINFLIRFLQTSSKDIEVCYGTLMGLGILIEGVPLPCRDLGKKQPNYALAIQNLVGYGQRKTLKQPSYA